MAPEATSPEEIDEQIRLILHSLYIIIVQSYDYHGPQTSYAMASEIKDLVRKLVDLTRATRARPPILVPPEVIDYVENGRNPDIYTREFVELVQRDNQQLKGRAEAFAKFRDMLAEDVVRVLPECEGEIGRMVGTGRIEQDTVGR